MMTNRFVQEDQLRLFRDLIAGRLGMRRLPQEERQLAALLARRTQEHRLPSPERYLQWLAGEGEEHEREWRALAPVLSVGESFFFRDRGQMALLENVLLPERIANNASRRELRLLSAGCSTGEEPYSLAMLLDRLGIDWTQWNITIIGVDINSEALARARTGRFTSWSLRGMSEADRDRHFRHAGTEWLVDERLRRQVRFESLNLARDKLPDEARGLHGFDLIMCRNVFIYFDSPTTEALVTRLAASLQEGGYLITGHAELQGICQPDLLPVLHPGSLVFRRDAAALRQDRKIVPHRASSPSFCTRERTHPRTRPIDVGAPAVSVPASGPARARVGGAPAEKPASDRQRVMQATDDLAALKRLACAYANQGDHRSAQACCDRLMKLAPLDAEGPVIRAQIDAERGDLAAARHHLNRALYLDCDNLTAHLQLASLLRLMGEHTKANLVCGRAWALMASLPDDATVPLYESYTTAQLRAEVAALRQELEAESHG